MTASRAENIELLKTLKASVVETEPHNLETVDALVEAIWVLEWLCRPQPMLTLYEGPQGPALNVMRSTRWGSGMYVQPERPVIEKLSEDRARLVIGISGLTATLLREDFNWPIQPAALDATEAIVRATHALAGAAIELTHVARTFRGGEETGPHQDAGRKRY